MAVELDARSVSVPCSDVLCGVSGVTIAVP